MSRREAHKFTLALGTILGEPPSAAVRGPRGLLSWALRPRSVDQFQEAESHTEGSDPLLQVQPGLGPAASAPSVLLPEAGLLPKVSACQALVEPWIQPLGKQ